MRRLTMSIVREARETLAAMDDLTVTAKRGHLRDGAPEVYGWLDATVTTKAPNSKVEPLEGSGPFLAEENRSS